MNNLQIKTSLDVAIVFNNYPEIIQNKISNLRRLIIETANEIQEIKDVEETLKWGEPSYITKHGSTVRIDWKEKNPKYYSIYFKCTSKLVPTFKTIYNDIFKFEGNRAITFGLDDKIPEKEIKHCISMALTYHKIKHLPMLGA